LGIEPAFSTPEAFTALMRSELPKWAAIVKRSGATADFAPGNDPTDWLAGWHPQPARRLSQRRRDTAQGAVVAGQPRADPGPAGRGRSVASAVDEQPAAIAAWAAQRFSAP
jgi:hypothetical protein